MALVVQKYGGSSVSDIEAVRRVARRVVATREAGNTVVVVVSAMGDTTDELLAQAAQQHQRRLPALQGGFRPAVVRTRSAAYPTPRTLQAS